MSSAAPTIVSLRNVGKTFDSGTVALDGFNLDVRAGVVKRDIDFHKAYTLRFINKGVGLNLRPKK